MRSLLKRFLMSISAIQLGYYCISARKIESLKIETLSRKKRKDSAVEGSAVQISTTRHWRRSNEMIQGRLLDNSFSEKNRFAEEKIESKMI